MSLADNGFQVHFAEAIKKALPNTAIGAVGLITEAEQAEEIVSKGRADVVSLARELIRDPNFPLRAAHTLGAAVKPPNQYERAWAKVGDVDVFSSGNLTQQFPSDAHSC
jgi:2,4-dienoyl-CoA reductase-like NADH-dependent reductase (Old Yellow Enzyme family)